MFRRVFWWIDARWEWIKGFFAILMLCRFSILVLLFVAAVVVFTAQGQDVLRAMIEAPNYSAWQIFLFYLSLLLWATSSWYWARVMLRFRFKEAPEGYQRVKAYTPRILGILPFIIVAYAFYITNIKDKEARYFSVATLVLGAIFLVILIIRVPALERVSRVLMRQKRVRLAKLFSKSNVKTYQRLSDIAPSTWIALALLGSLAAALFLLFLLWLQASAFLGTATILFLAAASWIAFGSILVYFGTRYSFPVMTLLLLAAIIFSSCNDNHTIRYLDKKVTTQESVKKNFQKWAERFDKNSTKTPYFIVAAEGGGIRAAYTTGLFLSQLQESNSAFAKHLFAISSVSGGSLGAAAFVAMLHRSYEEGQRGSRLLRCKIKGSNLKRHPFDACIKELFSKDFLSPAAAYMFYPDLVQRFLPFPIERFDRSLALEHSWELAWFEVFPSKEKKESNLFAKGFLNLWQLQNAKSSFWLPNLFLNSTWVETGKRVITSNLAIDNNFSDAQSLLRVLQRDIPLSSAVHNSARFTYVSPAGRVVIPDKNRTWGHLVDGGYFENSGTSTAYNILKEVIDANRTDMTPVVLVITNDPSIKEPCSSSLGGCKPSEFMNETISPIRALLATRSARASYARSEIKSYVESKGGLYIEVGLCKSNEPLPLGWTLSYRAEKNINGQLQNYLDEAIQKVGTKNFDPLNITHLKVLQSLLQKGCRRQLPEAP